MAGERLGDVTLIEKRGPRISFETSLATSSVSPGPMIAYTRSCLIRAPLECISKILETLHLCLVVVWTHELFVFIFPVNTNLKSTGNSRHYRWISAKCRFVSVVTPSGIAGEEPRYHLDDTWEVDQWPLRYSSPILILVSRDNASPTCTV